MDGLRALAKAGVEIRHTAGLHAKVFLIDGSGWAGSANLTGPGLGQSARPNLELSVALSSTQSAEAATVLDLWRSSAKPVTGAMLDECEARAALIPVRTSPSPGGGPTASAGDKILQDALEATVWVKAVYQDATQANAGWARGAFVTSSKRGRPSFVPGDLLLIYAKHAAMCSAVLEVKAEAYINRGEQVAAGITSSYADRWPWITPIKVRLHVPSANGVTLAELGLNGRSLQGGHCRMPTGGLAAAVRHMTSR